MRTLIVTIVFSAALLPAISNAQLKMPKILSKVTGSAVSEGEAGQGIKEALTQGVTNAVLNLNKTDAFFTSEIYKVLMPPDAKKIESTLRRVGMGAQVDKAILAINRGAEDALQRWICRLLERNRNCTPQRAWIGRRRSGL